VGGHKELIEHNKTGTLFAADDPLDLAKSINRLFDNRANWDDIRATARQFVNEERSWQTNIYRYDPVYHSLLLHNRHAKAT
jgi:glycosyltransferase involved in cell wall biosynthesis